VTLEAQIIFSFLDHDDDDCSSSEPNGGGTGIFPSRSPTRIGGGSQDAQSQGPVAGNELKASHRRRRFARKLSVGGGVRGFALLKKIPNSLE